MRSTPEPMGTMIYGGIIFDFNGTLFFDSDKQEEAWRIVSRQLRGQDFTRGEMREKMHGRPSRAIFEYLLGKPLAEDEVWRLSEQKEEIYRELCLRDRDGFRLCAGAEALLDRLVRAEIPRTIATASEITNVRFFIRHFGLERWFDPERIVYDDGTLPGKPAPDIYLKAARRIGLPPARCLVAEDAASGIEAARRAGAGCIVAMNSGAVPGPVLRQLPGVDRVIGSFDEFDGSLLGLDG